MSKEELLKKRKKISSRGKGAARQEEFSSGGLYFGDYRPRYEEQYNIYEKAKLHIKDWKKNEK